eukprot:CAMPEP_0183334322 /NCGR_PEP_ID=MMETSP0164_2-20130417/2968_1 /TAXON_ID=221442 /ORGANISM="Coccolithus pelagicus ssp braarudi, Strain PLY182g" /LENGTH=223 /DNA_ID=CAMNT_0025503439 /DNA_START=11 /DNA_END=682 /DNA_ORIENTATION=+
MSVVLLLSAASVNTMIPRSASAPRVLTPREINRPGVQMTGADGKSSLEQMAAQVISNMNEGELSTRGEGWAIGQGCLVVGVLFAPSEPVQPAVEAIVGLAAIGAAIALGGAAISDLGVANLTPWPKPVQQNELKTEGVYSLCRHPMYASLIAGCFGLSLLSLSFERLLLTVALFALLSFKVGREEPFLNKKHGEAYRAYAEIVPQFFPTIDALKKYVADSWDV